MADFFPIPETSARDLLRAVAGPLADGLRATRRDGGWSFAWDAAAGEPPVGASRWVVGDNGLVSRLGLREPAAVALASAPRTSLV